MVQYDLLTFGPNLYNQILICRSLSENFVCIVFGF